MGRFSRFASLSFPNPGARLPDVYYKHLVQRNKLGTRVHDKEVTGEFYDLKWNDEYKRIDRVPDMPVPITYPKESQQGLWAGEGIFKGYIKPRKYFQAGWPRAKTFFPNLKKIVLYSEILDEHFNFIVTGRTLDLIDEFQGLDAYLLRSPVEDLKSEVGLLLRRQMLLNLVRGDFKTPEIAKEMKEKYADCIIPEEEAEWIGLPLKYALTKQRTQEAKANAPIPLKYQLAKDLIAELDYKKNNPDPTPEPEAPTGLFGKVKSKLGLGKKDA